MFRISAQPKSRFKETWISATLGIGDDTMPEVFVVAPFGVKSADLGHGIPEIDFDRIYKEVVQPAAHDAGFEATRADSALSTETILESVVASLLRADVVLADVSLPNGNVFYELGIRHAISNGPTILIAHQGTRFPFDIAHRKVFPYELTKLADFRPTLERVLRFATTADRDEPVLRSILSRKGIAPASGNDVRFEQDLKARIERAEGPNQLIAVWHWARSYTPLAVYPLVELAKRLQKGGDYVVATEILERLVAANPADFELRRKLGWSLRKLGRSKDAEIQLLEAIRLNESDPEARGIMGGLLKSQARYEEAGQQYAHGAKISPNDAYMLVNLGACRLLASSAPPDVAREDYQRAATLLEKQPAGARDVWTELTLGEAYMVLGDLDKALEAYRTAAARPDVESALDSARGQLALLGRIPALSSATTQCAAALSRSAPKVAQMLAASVQQPSALPVLLHLSDLHFGTRPGSDGSRVEMHRFKKGDWEKTLLEHLTKEFHPKHGHFRFTPERLFLVVSGDLTYCADTDEFEKVGAFLKGLCSSLQIPRERVAIAPGNHDVSWTLAKNERAQRFDNFLVFLNDFYGDELSRHIYPKVNWDLRLGKKRPEAIDLFAVIDDARSGLQLVVLNSCVHEDDVRHWGFMGGRQLEQVEEQLRERATQASTRVAVFHHHLHQYPEPPDEKEPWVDKSVVRDGALVEKWLEQNRFDMVLHGHKHKPQLRETVIRGAYGGQPSEAPASSLIVCGSGSAGVNAKELEQDVPNQYQVIELLSTPRAKGADFVRVEWRQLAATPAAEWITPGKWVLSG